MFGDYVFEKQLHSIRKKCCSLMQTIWKKKRIIARCFRRMASGLLCILMI